MPEIWSIILIHQIVFQGMFVFKNITLRQKIKKPIQGKNSEAVMSIIYFSSIIIIALFFSFSKSTFGEINILSESLANIVGLALLVVNLLISITSLIHLGDSWRAGVIEYQKTKLITSGIYKYTRNPYFLSYLLMFFAYTVLLQNLILLGLSLVAIFFVHKMILREEEYLEKNHKNEFLQYKAKVPRYIMVPVCIQDKISGQYPEGGK